jgi:hypothetical protein
VKRILAVPLLALLLVGGLHLPTGDHLEFYDVKDLVYTMDNFKMIDLNPPPVYADVLITGMELADQLAPLVPGDDRMVEFQNGYLIVRATTLQHLSVRGALALRSLRNVTFQFMTVGIYHLKTTLPNKLFGMITA